MIIEYSGFPVGFWLEGGVYKFECWGASGGSLSGNGGRGSYVSGKLVLGEKTFLHFYVGESGKVNGENVTFNGGGRRSYQGTWSFNPSSYGSSGGGSTDIRLLGGSWDDFDSLKTRIMVAGGGGGETKYEYGSGQIAHGGFASLIGFPGSTSICCANPGSYTNAQGGTQEIGGNGGIGSNNGVSGGFGYGGNSTSNVPSSGGGGGYFGGGGGGMSSHVIGSGGGGSSFISGHPDCSAISDTFTQSSPTFNGSIHYSGIEFFEPIIKNGNELFKSPSGIHENGHSGNGYIRVVPIYASQISRSNTIVFHIYLPIIVISVIIT